MDYAPILLFTYNRLEHTKRTIEHLVKNDLAKYSFLYIYSDGPKNSFEHDIIEELRNYLKSVVGFKKVNIICRYENYGLAKNIISGVTEVCNEYGKVIVLEDDIITSSYFLNFMNDGIDKYHTMPNVSSIHGFVYPTNINLPETFFIKGADCWGWATWSSAWSCFEFDGSKLLNEIKNNKLQKEFNFKNTFDYYQMLEDQVNGKNDSWAIRWYASCFLKNMYTLYPGKSLVVNFGFDNSGIHSGETNIFNQTLFKNKINVKSIPIAQSDIGYKAFMTYFKKNKFYNSKLKKLMTIDFIKYFRKLN